MVVLGARLGAHIRLDDVENRARRIHLRPVPAADGRGARRSPAGHSVQNRESRLAPPVVLISDACHVVGAADEGSEEEDAQWEW